MQSREILPKLISFSCQVLNVCGLTPFRYDAKSKTFKNSIFSIIFAFTFVVIFSTAYPVFYKNRMNKTKTSMHAAHNLAAPYMAINVSAAIIIFIITTFESRKSVVVMNQTLEIFLRLGKQLTERTCILITVKTLTKVIGIPAILETALVTNLVGVSNIDNIFDFLAALTIIVPYLYRSLAPNVLYGAILISTEILKILNEQMQQIMKRVIFVNSGGERSEHTDYFKMEIFCQMSDQLDKIAEEYFHLCRITKSLVNLSATALLFSLFCDVYVLIVQLFVEFVAITNSIIDSEPYNFVRGMGGMTYSLFLLVDIFLIVSVVAAHVTEVRSYT